MRVGQIRLVISRQSTGSNREGRVNAVGTSMSANNISVVSLSHYRTSFQWISIPPFQGSNITTRVSSQRDVLSFATLGHGAGAGAGGTGGAFRHRMKIYVLV